MALVYGVGINDADYVVQIKEEAGKKNGKRSRKRVWTCPYYNIWMNLLRRCFCPAFKKKHPTYEDVTVYPDWLRFSVFKAWMETQDWEGKELDKDILVPCNKTYSPETCVFVPRIFNTFVLESHARSNNLPIGVVYDEERGKYRANCRDPINNKNKFLGRYPTIEEAHSAWLKFKLECAKALVEGYEDKRVVDALIKRYQEYKEPLYG